MAPIETSGSRQGQCQRPARLETPLDSVRREAQTLGPVSRPQGFAVKRVHDPSSQKALTRTSLNGAANRPPMIKPRSERSTIKAECLGPVSQDVCFASVCQRSVVTVVSRLFGPCCPPAIPRRVRTVVVNAIKAMTKRWARSHVGQECRETPSPPRTNNDPTGAIVLERWVPRIVAAFLCALPRMVCRASRVPMRGKQRTGRLVLQAATTTTGARSQTISLDVPDGPTCTSAIPVDDSAWTLWWANHRPSTEMLTRQVASFGWHQIQYISKM